MAKEHWKLINLVGNRYGKLKVLRKSSLKKGSPVYWDCICDCGAKVCVAGLHLKRKKTLSCGCLRGTSKLLRNKRKLKCFQCRVVKSFDDFYNRGGGEKGKRQPCKDCSYWNTTTRQYKLTLSQAKKLRSRRTCSICKSKSNLVIDHNHVTGKVRAVICHSCNMVLGFCKEDISLLEKIKEYLIKHESPYI